MDTRLGENPMDQQAKEGKAKEEAFQERIHAEAERRLEAMSQASVSSDATSTNTGQAEFLGRPGVATGRDDSQRCAGLAFVQTEGVVVTCTYLCPSCSLSNEHRLSCICAAIQKSSELRRFVQLRY
jgi:hypothetical protein